MRSTSVKEKKNYTGMISFRFFEFTIKSIQRREGATNRHYTIQGSKQYHETGLYRLYQTRRDFDSCLVKKNLR